MLVFCPCLWLAIEAITSTSTSTGATAFSAPTNREPSRPTAEAAAGETSANRMPATVPTMICLTVLPCVIFCSSFCIVLSS